MHPEPAPGPVLRLDHVTVVRGGTTVLHDVSWCVGDRERWVVLGPNGSGKTTIVDLAAGFLFPSVGTVEVLGGVLGRIDVRALRARLGLTSADLSKQLRPEVAALELVMSGRHGALETWWHDYGPADRDRARSLLDRAGVARLAEHPYRTLSEGERQQVLLARALVAEPELLLLDEPNAGLDMGARESLVHRLGGLAADPASPPMVLVTHHVEEIPAGFTHAVLLRAGRVHAAGPLDEVLVDASLSECFGLALRVVRHGARWSCHAV
ncbi:MAG TPA: ATP-binding cassette domain-containing protein [Acidimicrobiales bacterium]|nr:ATP-binding cassette domain-containing protein [Acidimicrobiales bacterium]